MVVMRVFPRWFQLLVLNAAVVCVSCTVHPTDSDPSKVEPAAMVPPKVGSSFMYEYVDVDTLTGLEIDSTRDTVTMHVSQVGIEHKERANVTVFERVIGSNTIPTYCSYDPDGNVYFILHNALRGKEVWYRTPITGETTSTTVISDKARIQTDQFEYSEVEDVDRITIERTGTGEDVVQSTAIAVVTMKQSYLSTTTRNGYPYGDYHSAGTFTFAPNLGVWVNGEHAGKMRIRGKVTYSVSRKSKLIAYTLVK